ncbi:hypothetical protein L6164_016268 [Bauhinia variegata]|uniref:Uncharacterized protein n=1 Tax=Bauhinia variegata TaxID=167791 RepID=A0ACB9NN79_BAUVA|nr:hypothetical protein L6164_016268 [Bauhinia variegata]
MDREPEELLFLGVIGVYQEACNIIFSWKKIFAQITLSLILPLSFIFLFQIQVSEVLFGKIVSDTNEISRTQEGTPQFDKLSDLLSSEWASFCLFELAYFTFLLIFSLLSTSAVVFTVASIYTARDVTFKKVMSVVPKVWKRLMVTFLCTFVAFFTYNVLAMLVGTIWALTIRVKDGGVAILVVILFVYFIGLLYLTVIWQLASVVSVLEDSYGILAMMKSKELMKGKMGLAIFIFLTLNLSFFLVKFLFKTLVVHGGKLGYVDRTAYGIVCFLLISKLFLFSLVIQTVLYFVCKSYHHENIDKSALSDHLEVFLGEYAPLKTKDVQVEQCHV